VSSDYQITFNKANTNYYKGTQAVPFLFGDIMEIHVKATKEEVLESLTSNKRTIELPDDKVYLEVHMGALISNAIDDSADVSGFNITVTIEDM